MIYNLENNLSRINTYQNQMATGKKINKPSDDPVEAARILKFRSDLSQLEMFEANAEDARSWMDITESSVNDVVQAVQRVRELTVQAANGVYTDQEREKIASEIEEIRDHIIQDGNTSYAGRYIFSNFYTDEPLFNDDGTYNIPITQDVIDKPNPILYEIAVGEEMDVNTSPMDVFGYIEETNAVVTTMPDGISTESTSGGKSGIFDLTKDFSVGTNNDATVDFTVDGTVYTIQSADLTALVADPLNPHLEADIVNLINNADDGAGPPANFLSTVADVSFDSVGKLVVSSKTTGPLSSLEVAYNPDTGGGLTALDLEAAFGLSSGVANVLDGSIGTDPVGDLATKAVINGTFDLTSDFSTGGNDNSYIEIDIDGTVFTIQSSDLTNFAATAFSPHDKEDVLNLINQADDGTGPPANELSSMADVYFDTNDQLVIKSRSFGATSSIEITYTGDTGGGLTAANIEAAFGLTSAAPSVIDGTLGVDKADAIVVDKLNVITDADVAANAQEYLDNRFLVSLNGETREIQIDSNASLFTVADLETAIETALDSAFPGNVVDVTAVDNGKGLGEFYFEFSSTNQPNNGDIPILEVEVVKATKSKLIDDLDNILNSLRNGDPEDVLSGYLGDLDDDLEMILTSEANIGARTNRIELVINRIEENNLTYTSLLSEAQDADMAEVIMLYQNAQNVYRASLSTGAQAIQPTLIDFIR